MEKKVLLSIITGLFTIITHSQTITGNLSQHQDQEISLTGFNYDITQELSKTLIDSLGNFTLNYPKNYKGMAVLNTQDNSSLIVVLSENNVSLTGTHLKEPNGIAFTNSKANTNFVSYAKHQALYKQALSGWNFLQQVYNKEALFSNQMRTIKDIAKAQKRIHQEDAAFIASLDKQSYLRWFIPHRTLVQDMPYIVRHETHRIPEAIQQFRTTDFKHPNFKTSGLFKELIEGHYMLLENMGQSLDSVYTQMNVSTQYLINNLQENDSLLNKVSNQLFNYFEKRSLFTVSEYLSVSLLNYNQCALEDNLAVKLESYRKMKQGNTAPDILFENGKKLSAIKRNKLVVFGASWCPHCTDDLPKLNNYYTEWKNKNTDIIYISIDTNKDAYTNTYLNKPWQTYCDFKGWDTPAAKDYFVSGTPTYFLLDSENKILLRPKSLEHANVWITQTL